MRSSISARAGVGARPENPGSSSHVATHSPSRSDHDVRNEYGGMSCMARRPRGLEQPLHLPRLRMAPASLLQVERAQLRMVEDPMPAHLPHLGEPELPAELQRLLDA